MMEYNTLIKNRRSIRSFTKEKVSPDILTEILQETCMAPSASNGQPWNFIVITDQTIIKKLSDESKKNLVKIIENDPNSSIKQYESFLRNPNSNVFYDAPCLVYIVGQNNHYHFPHDCSLAAAYFMFAATARNLGTCWIGLGEDIVDEKLKMEIGLPNDYQIAAAIIIGHPRKIPSIAPRDKPKVLKII